MADHDLPQPEEPEGPIADAAGLFSDEGPSVARNDAPAPAETSPEAYEVGDIADTPPVRPVPEWIAPIPGPSRAEAAGLRAVPPRSPEGAGVEVWSRFAEWKGTLFQLAVAFLAMAGVCYVLVGLELYGLAFLAFVLGSLGMILLSYPILITLERPVRVTPEQAVRDYYGALSHHRPHFRRMWLLLSDAGKYRGPFASFEGFRGYWSRRLTELQRGRASSLTPLRFVVARFRSEKSAGRSEIRAEFDVEVLIRGRQAEGPVETIACSASLVKGPDGMWYLDRGTLP